MAVSSAAGAASMRCGLCSYEFDPAQLTCHGACPLGAHCLVVCCPRCGYSTVNPARSPLAQRLVGALRLGTRAARAGARGAGVVVGDGGAAIRLLDLQPGQAGHVADVAEAEDTLIQLSQYGLLPGTPIRLARKYPVPIIQVGQTDLALDRTLAARIYVDL